MMHILDFCGECGVLLPAKDELNVENCCDNCGADVTDRSQRIQGAFEEVEAKQLRTVQGLEQ